MHIPKMHFLIHYPDQMRALGPMVRTWTIQHEAKLNFFKKASHLTNFKNIALSLANCHQRWMCYELAGQGLLHNLLGCGPAKSGIRISQIKNEIDDIQRSLIDIIPSLTLEATIFRPVWLVLSIRVTILISLLVQMG